MDTKTDNKIQVNKSNYNNNNNKIFIKFLISEIIKKEK